MNAVRVLMVANAALSMAAAGAENTHSGFIAESGIAIPFASARIDTHTKRTLQPSRVMRPCFRFGRQVLSMLGIFALVSHCLAEDFYISDGRIAPTWVENRDPLSVNAEEWQIRLFPKGEDTSSDRWWGLITGKSIWEVQEQLRHCQEIERLTGLTNAMSNFNPLGPIAVLKKSEKSRVYQRQIDNALGRIFRATEVLDDILRSVVNGKPAAFNRSGDGTKEYLTNLNDAVQRVNVLQKAIDRGFLSAGSIVSQIEQIEKITQSAEDGLPRLPSINARDNSWMQSHSPNGHTIEVISFRDETICLTTFEDGVAFCRYVIPLDKVTADDIHLVGSGDLQALTFYVKNFRFEKLTSEQCLPSAQPFIWYFDEKTAKLAYDKTITIVRDQNRGHPQSLVNEKETKTLDTATAREEIERAELKLTTAYRKLYEQVDKAARKSLTEDQRQWIKVKDAYPENSLERLNSINNRIKELEQSAAKGNVSPLLHGL